MRKSSQISSGKQIAQRSATTNEHVIATTSIFCKSRSNFLILASLKILVRIFEEVALLLSAHRKTGKWSDTEGKIIPDFI